MKRRRLAFCRATRSFLAVFAGAGALLRFPATLCLWNESELFRRTTGNPEVISSPVGLVPTNALVVFYSRVVGKPEGIQVPRCGLVLRSRLLESNLRAWPRPVPIRAIGPSSRVQTRTPPTGLPPPYCPSFMQ